MSTLNPFERSLTLVCCHSVPVVLMFPLSSLPAEILAQVLNGDNSHLVIALFKCGDSLLEHKLTSSITTVKLVDKRWWTTSRYPKCLSRLHRLRSLSIDRSSGYLIGSEDALVKELKSLPQALEELHLFAIDASSAALYEVHDASGTLLKGLGVKRSDLYRDSNVVTHFMPSLKILSLDPCPAILPPSLTKLCVPWLSLSLAEQLPRSLEVIQGEIRFEGTAPLLWGKLPPTLTQVDTLVKLMVIGNPNLYSDFPPSLTRFKLDAPVEISSLKTLPPQTRCLKVDYYGRPPSGWLELLPSRLHTLELIPSHRTAFSHEALKSLPRTLTTLRGSITVPWEDIDRETDWPSGLTFLGASDFMVPPQFFHCLPRSLRRLKILWQRDSRSTDLSGLPSLTRLSIRWPYLDDDGLEISDGLCDPRNPFPSTLTSLSLRLGIYWLASFPKEKLSLLPQNLTSLKINLKDDNEGAEEAKSIIALPPGLTSLWCGGFSGSRFQDLPRGITDLKLGGNIFIPPNTEDAFQSLPASLTSLEIEAPGFIYANTEAYSSLSFASLPNLRSLKVSEYLGPIDAGFLKGLPTGLKCLHVQLDNFSPETAPLLLRFPDIIDIDLKMSFTDQPWAHLNWPISAEYPTWVGRAPTDRRVEAHRRSRLYPDPRVILEKK